MRHKYSAEYIAVVKDADALTNLLMQDGLTEAEFRVSAVAALLAQSVQLAAVIELLEEAVKPLTERL